MSVIASLSKLSFAQSSFDEVIILISFDFEARGDRLTADGPMHPLETLASMGAVPIFFGFMDNKCVCRIKVDWEHAFEATFPTPFTDEEWATKPTTASSFFEKFPALLEGLRADGHHHEPDRAEYLRKMKMHAKKFFRWLDHLPKTVPPCAKVSVFGTTDTASSDWCRLSSLMAHGGRSGVPYDRNNMWNGFRQLNYDQLQLTGKMVFDSMDLETFLRRNPVKRNHRAVDDAHAQAYEAALTIIWVASKGQSHLRNEQSMELTGGSAFRLYEFLMHL